MAEKQNKESKLSQDNKTKIIVALIGLLGAIIVALIGLFSIGTIQFKPDTSTTATPQIIKMGYMYADWDPHFIDLAAAEQGVFGVPVRSDYSLQFHYFAIKVPKEYLNERVEIIFSVDGEQIGKIEHVLLDKPITELHYPAYELIDKYQHVETENAWQVQREWVNNKIEVHIVKDGTILNIFFINLVPTSSAWYNTPNYASFIHISYSVNDGDIQVVDFRRIMQDGIPAGAGDKLVIHEVWYETNTLGFVPEQIIFLEGYPYFDGWDWDVHGEYHHNSGEVEMLEGINFLEGSDRFIWESLPDNVDQLVLTLTRFDSASSVGEHSKTVILDRLALPFVK